MIDDLLTTGLTIKAAVDAIQAEGGIVTDSVVFLDREEGGKEQLEQNGVNVHALLKISEVAKILYFVGAIDQESFKTVLKQVKH